MDDILRLGSGSSDGKLRIFQRYQEDWPAKESAEFLRQEYGVGGRTMTLKDGTRGQLWHDHRGIGLRRSGDTPSGGNFLLTWPKADRRVRQLIQDGTYLTAQETTRLRAQRTPGGFACKPGDIVYLMDGRRYEVEQAATVSVTLRDPDFPLLKRVTTAADFELQLAADPRNYYLPPRPKLAPPAPPQTLPEPQPEAARNFHIADDNLGVGGPKAKFAANIAAITLLKGLEADNRPATAEEQDTLSRYVGWGGVQEAFDSGKENWRAEYAQLKALLTEEEYKSAMGTVLNAHYTSPTVIRAMYQCVEDMGFRTGNIADPGLGVGNFLGLLPECMAGSRLYGSELDGITGRIAQKLYPNADIQVRGYEKTDWPDNFFDLMVGNVPFGRYGVSDPRYDRLKLRIHDYFFVKSIDQTRPGGVIAFITSHYTMDKRNSAVRRYIAQRCDLLGAVRLPNNAFLANAGTEVTADILFLQKRDRAAALEPAWVQTGELPGGLIVNQYFIDHPEMVLGTMTINDGHRMYGDAKSLTCEPFPGGELGDLLAGAVSHISAELPVFDPVEVLERAEHNGAVPADPNVRNFSYTEVNGQLYFRENSQMSPVEATKMGERRLRGMLVLRDAARRLIDAQMDGCGDAQLHDLQWELDTGYDSYTAKYGLLNSRGNSIAFSDDSSYPLLCALEVLGEEGALERKADLFTKRTIRHSAALTHADTPAEALAVSIGELARVDLVYMATLLGPDADEEAVALALRGAIFRVPGAANSWLTADEYLSGNVRKKLEAARYWSEKEPGRYDENVEALTVAQPADLGAGEIGVKLGTVWIPPADIRQFMFETLETPPLYQREIDVLYAGVTGAWSVKGKSADCSDNVKSNVTYGTKRINAYELVQESLNLKDVRIFDTVQVDSSERRILNRRETILAQQKQAALQGAFSDWIWGDPARRERLTRYYNDTFNNTRPRQYDGSHIRFVGMNPEIVLRKHQTDAVGRILYGGNTLLAHVVGAGKTWTMAAAAMEGRRLGLCRKSLFVVPGHLTEQWGAEFLQLYPAANLLVASRRDFETSRRKQFCARIATGDYDAVIIGHSQFEKIPVSRERQEAQLERQIDEIGRNIATMKAEDGERFTVKQMVYTQKTLEEKLKKLTSTQRKDDTITFEELGVDRLFIDEAHFFKNMYLYTKMRNVAGINQTEAQKSADLYMKCAYMDEQTGGRGNIFATGTPISNSMVELYTMMRYLQSEMLAQRGLAFFDGWASTFGETVTAIELAPEGTGYRAKTRFARFINLPELMNLWREATDIQTADMLNLPVPPCEHHTIVVQPTDLQKALVAELGRRAERVRGGGVDPTVDNMLRITGDGRKLALDQRMMDSAYPDNPDGKVNACVENIVRIWTQTEDALGTQLIFSDLSTPREGGQSGYCVYEDIRDKLVARGVPATEIAFIHSCKTDLQKADLFAKVRAGLVRVLLGSTNKMGAGTNVQTRLAALHHMDVPWRPSEDGRTQW